MALLWLQGPAPGALEQLASAVAAQVRDTGARAPLAVAVSAPGHPALQAAFLTLLLSRLDALGLLPRKVPATPEAEALARASGARGLLRLRLTLDGSVAAAGDVLPTWENFFSGRGRAPQGPAAVVFSQVAPDAAVRALARAPDAPALVLQAAPVARWAVRTAALAAGDMDGDGRDEVAVLTEEAVEVLRPDGQLLARRRLEGLPPAQPQAREPFGTLCICRGLLYAYSAAHAGGEVLALQGTALVLRAPLARPVVGCGQPPLEATLLPGVARLAPAGPGWPVLPAGPAAWGLFVRATGRGPVWLVLREDGTALAQGSAGLLQPFQGVGAGAALWDAAGDGTLRLAASSAALWPVVDTLRLLPLSGGAAEGLLEVPGRILQLTAALDGDGTEALVLGVWRSEGGAELRLVRGAR